jgi:hypothetical protein
MSQPSPLSVLSGAWKIADKATVALEAVGNKIRVNSQGWEDCPDGRRSPGRNRSGAQGATPPPARAPAGKFEQIDRTGLRDGGYRPEDFE